MRFFCSPKYPPSSYPERLPEYLQKQQESSASVFIERVPNNADDALIEEVNAVLTRSFTGNRKISGEAMFDWFIGPDFPRDDPKFEAQRLEFNGFFMKYAFFMALEYGLVVIARDGGPTGKVLGAVCAHPPGTAHVTNTYGWHTLKATFRIGQGPPRVLGKKPYKRVHILEDAVKKMHNPAKAFSKAANPNGTPPWYVHLLATDIDAQSRGCGSALLNCIHYLADCDAADTMLEYSGSRKEGYYCGRHQYKNFGEKVTLLDPLQENDHLACTATAAIRSYRQPQLPQPPR